MVCDKLEGQLTDLLYRRTCTPGENYLLKAMWTRLANVSMEEVVFERPHQFADMGESNGN